MKLNPNDKKVPLSFWRGLALSLSTTSVITSFFPLTVLANSIIYSAPSDTQNASFNGEMPIKQIGPLLLPRAVVQFSGMDVNVLAVPDWLFDRNTVLAGTLVNAQIDMSSKTGDLRGLVYFSDGLWLGNLASVNAPDVISINSGEMLRGRIRERLNNGFAFKPDTGAMRKILFTEIKNINSPRAYIFTIPSDSTKVLPENSSVKFDANTISFAPTFGHGFISRSARIPKSTLAGTEPGISKNQLAAMIGVNVVTELAPAIAIPLALNPGTNAQAQRELSYYNQVQTRLQGIPVPINFTSH